MKDVVQRDLATIPSMLFGLPLPHAIHGRIPLDAFVLSDEEYSEYLKTVLPTPEDEEALKEIFKQQWIEDKPLTPRQLATGIGATA